MKKTVLQIIAIATLSVLTVALVFFGITTVRFLWFRPLVVNGNSMDPTLKSGQLIYIDTTTKPKVGDVACFFNVTEEIPEGEPLPSSAYYGGNAYLRSMPIWGLKIKETYSGGYSILVKRVMATAGDTVEFRAEKIDGANLISLYRNGTKVTEDMLVINRDAIDEATQNYAAAYAAEHGMEKIHTMSPISAYTVPEGCLYVLGDNRGGSTDSRNFGAVQAALFVGVVH